MNKLILLRHGESEWNHENRFAGWTDVDLSADGINEAHKAAKSIRDSGLTFDIAFTSVLKRAIRTLWIIMDDLNLMWVPVYRHWRLNERHYGALQGLNKAETANKHGKEQVLLWRRSYDVRPPFINENDKSRPGKNPIYKDLPKSVLPLGECLKDTVERLMPYWVDTIVPAIKQGKRIIISAHGNSIRALIKYLDSIDDEEIAKISIPTGIPLVYELDNNLKPVKHYSLGKQEKAAYYY